MSAGKSFVWVPLTSKVSEKEGEKVTCPTAPAAQAVLSAPAARSATESLQQILPVPTLKHGQMFGGKPRFNLEMVLNGGGKFGGWPSKQVCRPLAPLDQNCQEFLVRKLVI